MLGTLFNQRYRIDAELGRGGVGIVYRGHDTVLERDVAIKVLSSTGIGTQGRARLMREAQAAARLNHPNIIQIFDAGELRPDTQRDDGSASYIVMELLEGASLFDHKPGSISEVLAIMQQVCSALEHAHANGIIHRDLKPENVILTPQGIAKLTDFGLARSVASRMTAEGIIVGTVFYLSPEQALGQTIDARSDLYSLGVMLYELTSGRLPFTAENPLAVISQHLHAPVVPPSTYNPEIPVELETLILALLSKQPQDRPASARDVRRTLEQIANGAWQTDLVRPERSLLEGLALGRMVGRDMELSEAKAIWKRAAAGGDDERVLLVSGEPGVGKTPFVREIKARAEITGAQALSAECYAEGGAPYAPFAQVIRNALTLIQSREPNHALESILPRLVLADLLTLAPELAAHYPQVPANTALEPQAEQQRLFESVFVLLSSVSMDQPLLLIIEDIQWADCGTMCLVRYLARRMRAESARQLIILSYREAELNEIQNLDEVLFDLTRERLAARIKLARYSREQTRQALAVMLQDEVNPDFLDIIYRETEGNVYFIEELCKALVEEGRLAHQDGHWQLIGMDEIQLPQSVRATILSRIGKLPEPAQEMLRLAAIIGREFDFATLRYASDQDEDTLIQALELAERAQLVEELKDHAKDESFAFTQSLIPATLQDSLSSLRRHRLHRRVAAAIAALRPEDDTALAFHYSRAGDEENALHHLIQAGNRAAAVYANEDAIRFYSEALSLIPKEDSNRFELLLARARVFDIMARREDQKTDTDELVSLAEKANDDKLRCDALLAQADLFQYIDQTRTHVPAEQAREIAQRIDDRVREARALRRLGMIYRQRKDYTRSRQDLELAITYFRQANLLNKALICLQRGYHAQPPAWRASP